MYENLGLHIVSNIRNYDVIFIENLHFEQKNLKIVDANVLREYPFLESANTFPINCSESEKNLESVVKILEIFEVSKVNRSSKVIFIGGGVLQDLATFASSIYLRGIDWEFYPTTLQSMIDSCIGGKSSLNFKAKKNQIGNFYPPNRIFIWVNFLNSLALEHIICGLVEGIKICAANSAESLSTFLKLCADFARLDFSSQEFLNIIHYSLQTKKIFIELDEFDSGIRRYLNYGHTFGHAIESSSKLLIPHGVAVAVGILAANNLARSKNLIFTQTSTLEESLLRLLSFLDKEVLKSANGVDKVDFLSSLVSDKKSREDHFVFILPSLSGLVEYRMPMSRESESDIVESLDAVLWKLA
jgi:3-dehydroquinate synthase